jgi:hypothetical protein
MQISFKFKNLKPVSTNQANATDFKTKRRFKTAKYAQFKDRVGFILIPLKKEIWAFEEKFDIYSQHLSMSAKFYIPKDIMFTKKGHISKRAMDWDNYLKISQDCIFNHFQKLDDCYIKHVSFIEFLVSPDKEHHFTISYKTRENKLLYEG